VHDLAPAKGSLTQLFPDSVDTWKRLETPQIYSRENLFDYMNGGAEIYLAYDFQQLAVQEYRPETEDSVQIISMLVEIWQMNSSADAFGIYSFDQEGESVSIGQEGRYSQRLLRFWKDKFFMRILGSKDNLKEIILKLGSRIDKEIKEEGKLPLLVSQIPSDSLVSGSVHFFRKEIILRNLYFFPHQNLLNLDELSNCVLADFKLGKDNLKLLLIQYPDTNITKNIQDSLRSVYMPDKVSAEYEIFQTEEEKLLGMDSVKNYLILVFEGKEEEHNLWLLNLMKNSLNQTRQ
jgi:hypothetical protein